MKLIYTYIFGITVFPNLINVKQHDEQDKNILIIREQKKITITKRKEKEKRKRKKIWT